MESADSRPRLPSRWAGVEAKLPPALDQLVGPALDEDFSLETLRDQLAFAAAYPDEAFSRYGAGQD